jgi:hypothetical protein
MTLEFHGGSVWDEITERVGNSPSQVHAAIAYIGKEAHNLLPLKKGDVLIVNASERSLSSGATNPYALEAFMSAGVEVHSAHELHAKVITMAGHTIVGSANASENSSDRCQEAFMVSSTNNMRNSVLEFVDDLLRVHSAPLLVEELPYLKQIFDSRSLRTKITGVTSPPERNELFGDENENYFLSRVQWNGDLTDSEEEYVLNATASDEIDTNESRYIDSAFQLPSMESGFNPGSIVILHSGGLFHPPAKVLGAPVLVKRPTQERTYGQTLRRFSDQTKRRRTTVNVMLQSLSHELSDDDLQHDEFRLNEVLRNGFIRLWHSDFAL